MNTPEDCPIKAGDRVKFRNGSGYMSEGVVKSVFNRRLDGLLLCSIDSGKYGVNLRPERLTVIPPKDQMEMFA